MKAVILAGGGGTRLWPLSTPEIPKQFQKLVSSKTMLEETIDRLDFLKSKDIYIAINKKHLGLTKKLCPKIPTKNIIIEPALRDTASCIGLASSIIAKHHPNEIMAVIYADHLVKNKKIFQASLKIAGEIAKDKNTLNIVEVEAKGPNTNYGYIKLGKIIQKKGNTEIYELGKFIEKPSYKNAKKFVASKKYLWNTGIYVCKAEKLLAEYEKHKPETYKKLKAIMKNPEKINKIYPTLEKISIDYAIMEKTNPKNIKIIKTKKMGWSDIGNWEAIYNELVKKKGQNIRRGKVKLLDCKGCLVYADNNKAIKAIGLRDTVIIDTKAGLLVCKKEQSKRIKELL